jgi:hypothetical protein
MISHPNVWSFLSLTYHRKYWEILNKGKMSSQNGLIKGFRRRVVPNRYLDELEGKPNLVFIKSKKRSKIRVHVDGRGHLICSAYWSDFLKDRILQRHCDNDMFPIPLIEKKKIWSVTPLIIVCIWEHSMKTTLCLFFPFNFLWHNLKITEFMGIKKERFHS